MKIVALLAFLGAVFLAGAFGASFPPGAWHAALQKPSWNPPGWLFGPVWTILYVCIAIAGYRIWQARTTDPQYVKARRQALTVWALQLVLNAGWSFLFFGAKLPGIALLEICAMLVTIVSFIAIAHKVDRTAARLFIPYAAWVSFATLLNFTLWRLNPGLS
jgi:translocator protein